MERYKSYPLVMTIIIKKYLKVNKIGNNKDILIKTKKYYRDFINEVPDIGGSKNIMSSNLYYALAFFAFYEAMERNINKDEFYSFLEKYMPKKIFLLSNIINMNYKWVRRLVVKMMERYKKKSLENNWANTWKVEINNSNKGISFNLITCPIADFAIKHDYKEIMPVLCKMDYLTAGLMHGKLIRKHTVITDNKPCDYLIIGDKKI